jgi:hypothetical protein
MAWASPVSTLRSQSQICVRKGRPKMPSTYSGPPPRNRLKARLMVRVPAGALLLLYWSWPPVTWLMASMTTSAGIRRNTAREKLRSSCRFVSFGSQLSWYVRLLRIVRCRCFRS